MDHWRLRQLGGAPEAWFLDKEATPMVPLMRNSESAKRIDCERKQTRAGRLQRWVVLWLHQGVDSKGVYVHQRVQL